MPFFLIPALPSFLLCRDPQIPLPHLLRQPGPPPAQVAAAASTAAAAAAMTQALAPAAAAATVTAALGATPPTSSGSSSDSSESSALPPAELAAAAAVAAAAEGSWGRRRGASPPTPSNKLPGLQQAAPPYEEYSTLPYSASVSQRMQGTWCQRRPSQGGGVLLGCVAMALCRPVMG